MELELEAQRSHRHVDGRGGSALPVDVRSALTEEATWLQHGASWLERQWQEMEAERSAHWGRDFALREELAEVRSSLDLYSQTLGPLQLRFATEFVPLKHELEEARASIAAMTQAYRQECSSHNYALHYQASMAMGLLAGKDALISAYQRIHGPIQVPQQHLVEAIQQLSNIHLVAALQKMQASAALGVSTPAQPGTLLVQPPSLVAPEPQRRIDADAVSAREDQQQSVASSSTA